MELGKDDADPLEVEEFCKSETVIKVRGKRDMREKKRTHTVDISQNGISLISLMCHGGGSDSVLCGGRRVGPFKHDSVSLSNADREDLQKNT